MVNIIFKRTDSKVTKSFLSFFLYLSLSLSPSLILIQEKLGVSSVHFIMQWFLTLFTSLPCWDSVLAIWDLFLLHGNNPTSC